MQSMPPLKGSEGMPWEIAPSEIEFESILNDLWLSDGVVYVGYKMCHQHADSYVLV